MCNSVITCVTSRVILDLLVLLVLLVKMDPRA